ncbi:MAG: response regulator [Chloroflexi bacterium]|nr:response regulator [Chloroflexota bacterium]
MPRPRILLVDDDRRVRQLVGLTLPADDYELSFAEDGADAIRAAMRLHPDLILLDYAMPGIHGVDVCMAIRAEASTARIPIIMLTGHGDDETRRRSAAAGANGFLTKPFSPLSLEETIRALLGVESVSSGASPSRSFGRRGLEPRRLPRIAPQMQQTASREPAERATTDSVGAAGSLLGNGVLRDTFLSTIEALATALELRGAQVEGHAQRVSVYTVAAGRRMGVDEEELEQIRWGSILHDVGMICVPDSILLKAGQLLPEEWALVRKHPEHGARLLGHIPGLATALAIVRFHHERFDGAGYPLGLRGTAIPLGARIFAVADALDAITTDRPYRPTRSWEEARVEILEGRGTHFDPSVVDVFLEIFDDLHGLTSVELPFKV